MLIKVVINALAMGVLFAVFAVVVQLIWNLAGSSTADVDLSTVAVVCVVGVVRSLLAQVRTLRR